MIDWSKLKTYQNNKYSSFEELCYQIAKVLHRDKGVFNYIDDSGGGDGVEFYMTLPNEAEWGWQAKFYYPNARLSVSGRKKSIQDSLKKACQVHPKLTKWILCTPTNFTSSEQKWFNEILTEVIPEDMEVELEHWGDSEFNSWLSEPSFGGKYHYFFGELELNMNWFQRQFNKQMAAIGGKFNPSLHTETSADTRIHAILGDAEFVKQIDKWIEKINEEACKINKRIDTIKCLSLASINLSEDDKLKIIKAAEALQKQLTNTAHKFYQARQLLMEKKFHELGTIDWKSIEKKLQDEVDGYSDIAHESGISKLQYTEEEKHRRQDLSRVRNIINSPASLIRDLLDKFFPNILYLCGLVGQAELHILGDAGIGKTHTACNTCDHLLKNELPAIFIRGSSFKNGQIEEQLRKILDIPPSYSWSDFLEALSACAESYRCRIPLIIDGLNEAVDSGTLSDIWKLELKGFVEEIKQIDNIVLITTCRKSYQADIWENENLKNIAYAHEFKDEEAEIMLEKYFDHYKIKADLTAAPLEQFKHPLYVKIFCETKNSDRQEERHIYLGEQTLFEIFDEYLEQCNKAVCRKLKLRVGTRELKPMLDSMTKYLWQHKCRHVPLEKLANMIDGKPRKELEWLSSKTHALESEGLLVCRDSKDEGEVMFFTYDLLGSYLIAKYLVRQHKNDLKIFLHREETIQTLFSSNYDDLRPMYEDISRCLAVVIPAETGQFLHTLSDNNIICSLSICGLFEVSPKLIDKHCVDLMSKLFKHKDNHKFLFEQAKATMASPYHPFNASFWSKQLATLSLMERDLSWTEYVRENSYYFESDIKNFEKLCKDTPELSDIAKKRLHLMAEYTMWMLTSTVRKVRDKATRALYWYGRRVPKEFFDLVVKSLSINDPYISERVLAATYGVTMARQHDFKDESFVRKVLPLYGRALYENMFKPDAPHSTTHIFARDYARRTIDISLLHHPNLLTNEEKQHIMPPFKDGIRKWGGSESIDGADHKNKTAILGLDFENYTIGRLVKNRAPYDSEHEEYKRVRANILWRVYNLGYSFELFETIDNWIGRENDRYEMRAGESKMDRYGKKYAWIAYYEVAGFREDNGLLKESFRDTPRILDIDIDPSFPDEEYGDDIIKQVSDKSIAGNGWIYKNNSLNVTPYLVVDMLCGDKMSWVLLDGYIKQKYEQSNSEMFAIIRGVIVKLDEADEIVEFLKQMSIGDWSMRSRPQDYCTYAGEIPWCDTYKKNNIEKFSVEEPKARVFKYVSPVRKNCWENGHSPILGSRGAYAPSKHIAEMFDLCGQPQTFDLFQKDGKRASISVECKEEGETTQNFTYLRKDLLDRYLKKINGKLIWLIFGERTLKSQDGKNQLKEVKIYRRGKKRPSK